ncbi:aldose epimerase family protein [Parapedobacter koreensis]|uniref:Aldose 1-epimerase n=1 Tax=Parapedobacter koreensis TaxID=332977 RepID=A0A1H7SKH0_9SPHI|nr:aldose epimerase family protein [Parapedobacter koreensis]SEL72958.1 aldose 1-epimerase [Parapedobacter koreensis]
MMEQYVIENRNGMRAGILNRGATITELSLPTRHGGRVNTVLAYPQPEDYLTDRYYVGTTIGRYANRIANGRFMLGDSACQLTVNEVGCNNHLHGGLHGFDKKWWSVAKHTAEEIVLRCESHDGEEGYPGCLQAEVTYRVSDEDVLEVHYAAKTDRTTVVSLSNHSYFNLSKDAPSIQGHTVRVYADKFTPLDGRNLPIGAIASVADTVFDLRQGSDVNEVMDCIVNTNYAFDHTGNTLAVMAVLTDKESGRMLTISSDYPGMQLYFGNFLGGYFSLCQGICLEPQYFPDSPNNSHFPSAILEPGEHYKHTINYKFSKF